MLIIHIGYHKTGSTAIQLFLEKNREILARERIIYPSGMSSWVGHPEFAWSFEAQRYPWQDKDYNFDEIRDHYIKFIRNHNNDSTIILSSEEFCRLEFDSTAIGRLCESVGEFNPVIIGYGRDPTSFLLSRYRHEVQMGAERRPLRDFLANFDNLQSAAFQVRMRVWEQAFPNSCIFRDYQKEASEHGSIVKSFLALADIHASSIDFELEEAEKKLHPLLADSARAIARSSLPDEQREALFGSLFALGDLLPPISEADLLQELADLGRTIIERFREGDVDAGRGLAALDRARLEPIVTLGGLIEIVAAAFLVAFRALGAFGAIAVELGLAELRQLVGGVNPLGRPVVEGDRLLVLHRVLELREESGGRDRR